MLSLAGEGERIRSRVGETGSPAYAALQYSHIPAFPRKREKELFCSIL